MTKKEMIEGITEALKGNPEKEVVVKQYNLMNKRWGYHGYCLVYQHDRLMLKPWSGANVSWVADLSKLKKGQVAEILNECEKD